MMRQTKNNKKGPILEDDESELEELQTTPTDVGDVSAAPTPTPAVTIQQADEPTAQQARFRRTWDFQPFIDELETDTTKPKTRKAKDYFTNYFKIVATFKPRTLMLFERWAELVDDNHRDDQMRDLIAMLHGRWDGHRGRGISIGNDREAKDENLRADLLELLRMWYPREGFGDERVGAGDAEEEDAGDTEAAQTGETSAAGHAFEPSQRTGARQQSTVRTSTRYSTTQASKPREDAAAHHTPEDRTALEHTILENWADHASTVPEHLPDYLGPAGVYWTDWPFDILEALVELSNVTGAEETEVIHAKLTELAPNAKTYSRARSLSVINAARQYFDKGKGKQTPSSQQDTSFKRPASNPPRSQRPGKHTRTAAANDEAPPAPPTQARDQLLRSEPQIAPPHPTTPADTPANLSPSEHLHYQTLSLLIMQKDSQRREAERRVERAMAERSAAYLNEGRSACAAAEVGVCDARSEVERLRGEIVGLLGRRWRIGSLESEGEVGEDVEIEVSRVGQEGVRRRSA